MDSQLASTSKIPPQFAANINIADYFTHMPTELFLSLVNRRLIEVIPDLDGLPHVQVDPAIRVLYFGILYFGCSLKASNLLPNQGADYAQTCYIGCLRSLVDWQRLASGRIEDFIAATFMVNIKNKKGLSIETFCR